MKLPRQIIYITCSLLILLGCSSSRNLKTLPVKKEKPLTVSKKKELSKKQKNNWQHLDLITDSIPGMSVNKAYEFLKRKHGKEVVVGVIDTGVDFKHEDLKDVVWVNKKEIKNNGKDDDNNGYIDDIHGWNFIGKMKKANFENHRILANPTIADAATVAKLKKEQEFDAKIAKQQLEILHEDKVRSEQMLRSITKADDVFTKYFGKKNYTKKDILAIKNADKNLNEHITFAKELFEFGENSLQNVKSEVIRTIKDINSEYNKNQQLIAGNFSTKDFRKILGDNPNDITDTNYGDNNVQPLNNSEMHGSHVSGIIAAKRNNGIGVNGVANNVKIMSLRAVPGDGDEHDKDVALAIRYAVDNGAKVINSSFGKSYSPYKKWVYDAIKYAADKDVLIVNAAGNNGDNIDKNITYPNDTPNRFTEIADNFLVVGASGSAYDKTIIPDFSNYGKKNVDIFAPGVSIYSTTPNNNYEMSDGTSMAAPCVAGVAALIRSYYPELTASQVKQILINSATKINILVTKPASMFGSEETFLEEPEKLVPLSNLSISGGIVNAYNAVKMADKLLEASK